MSELFLMPEEGMEGITRQEKAWDVFGTCHQVASSAVPRGTRNWADTVSVVGQELALKVLTSSAMREVLSSRHLSEDDKEKYLRRSAKNLFLDLKRKEARRLRKEVRRHELGIGPEIQPAPVERSFDLVEVRVDTEYFVSLVRERLRPQDRRVFDYFLDNPGVSRADAGRALGMTEQAVGQSRYRINVAIEAYRRARYIHCFDLFDQQPTQGTAEALLSVCNEGCIAETLNTVALTFRVLSRKAWGRGEHATVVSDLLHQALLYSSESARRARRLNNHITGANANLNGAICLLFLSEVGDTDSRARMEEALEFIGTALDPRIHTLPRHRQHCALLEAQQIIDLGSEVILAMCHNNLHDDRDRLQHVNRLASQFFKNEQLGDLFGRFGLDGQQWAPLTSVFHSLPTTMPLSEKWNWARLWGRARIT